MSWSGHRVSGVPDADLGQVVGAVVALTDPAALPELRTFLVERLDPAEVPARFVLPDALPRRQNGKVLKHELRGLLAEANAQL